MLDFYTIDNDYLDYLHAVDNKVPLHRYDTYAKFFCGIVLQFNDVYYFAPVSSFNKQQRTNFLIQQRDHVTSSIRFSFMLPVPFALLRRVSFNTADAKYRALLQNEYRFCNSNEDRIRKRALSIYRGVVYKRDPMLVKHCCDFKALEVAMANYIRKHNL